MSSWQPFTLGMIPGASEAMGATSEAAGLLSGVLNTLAGLLDSLAAVFLFLSDTVAATVAALMAAIQAIIDGIYAMLNSQVAFYLDKGPFASGAKPDGVSGFLSRFEASFYDEGDAHRPNISASTGAGVMLFLVGAEDLPSLQNLLALLGKLFGRPDLDWDEATFTAGLPERIERGMSTPPDWSGKTLGDAVPPLAQLGEMLIRALSMIEVGDSYSDMFQALADAVREKAAILSELSDDIQDIVDQIRALMESGLYVVSAEGSSAAEILQAIQTADNRPPLSSESYVAGVALEAQSLGPITELLGVAA